MFDDELAVIRAARRWSAAFDIDNLDTVVRLVEELEAAVRAFEKGRHLRPLKVRATCEET